MQFKNLTLDPFQEQAIKAIEKNHSVVVSAPTGSGKTLIADYIIHKDIKKGIKVIYTAPIKALSNQKYKDFCEDYGTDNVGLMTGDIVKNPGAPVIIMTTEIYRNMALTRDPIMDTISYVIFDEIHYINDVERGYVWEESIIFSKPNIRFLCLSATIPNAHEFSNWIESIKDHQVETIVHDKRIVPLKRQFFDAELGITTLKKIAEAADIPDYHHIRGRRRHRRPHTPRPSHIMLIKEIQHQLPCLFFCFSRKKTQDFAFELFKRKLFDSNPKIQPIMRKKLDEAPPEVKELESIKLLQRTLPHGIAFHHAGLIPLVKELVEELFGQGLIKVLYTTETFAVGINMPAKSVCFESLRKFDGINFRFLNTKEYFQIAGRAGRRGIDKEGFVYSMIVRKDFDFAKLKKLTDKDVDPIQSQFKLSVNTVLNLVKNHNEEEIDEILKNNFYTYQKWGNKLDKSKKNLFVYKFETIKKTLEKLKYIENNQLTEKGEFSSKIYSEEILTGEVFATHFYQELNEYQLLLLIAAICYEPRERTEIYNEFPSKFLTELKKSLKANKFLSKKKQFHYLNELTGIIHLCYESKTIFDILDNTNLLEGDIIRFFRQMLDRIGQIRQATEDQRLDLMLRSLKDMILNCLRDIDMVD